MVKTEPLHAQLYQLIKKRLIDGFYQPGERLVEVRLAEEFSVSRAPVREALRMLMQDGLLLQKGNALHVFDPTLQDMIDIYQCRQRLEALGANLAAANMKEEKLNHLKEIMIETKVAWETGDMVKVVSLNISFHEIVLEASGNQQLISLTSMIRDKVTYLRNCSFKGNVRNKSFLEEHEQIVKALGDRDGEKAEREMHVHIENDLQALISLYKNRG
ncbi:MULTISPECIES: GntR family transcriptional regulator [unclassified Bacillus (in: firmicutes)]|uniref:GntR family transcriptional regulator n=1 Tax=unclassified Bacillus (in: firmicutes) TaxID=185979 RepID=UPI0020D28A79|nr:MULTISPECIES: GntR family transcriptional regulator [unclassified Bacillus (in: firmicutes)]